MKSRPSLLLIHPAFLACLAALLLNDFYLKYQFHNAITGKLSDFTGLFAFAVFLAAIIPRHRRLMIVLSALFFCWWKSPLSEEAIRLVNQRLHWPVSRVVDYTDYMALLVMPLAYRLRPFSYPAGMLKPVVTYLSCIVSLFAFCATSMPRYMQATDTDISKNVRTPLKRKEIREKFAQQDIPLQKDTVYYRPLYSRDVYVETMDSAGNRQMLPVTRFVKGELYSKLTPYDSAYTLPWLLVRGDTLKNIHFSIDETGNGKKRILRLQSFLYDTVPSGGTAPHHWLRKKYRRPLTDRIKEILK